MSIAVDRSKTAEFSTDFTFKSNLILSKVMAEIWLHSGQVPHMYSAEGEALVFLMCKNDKPIIFLVVIRLLAHGLIPLHEIVTVLIPAQAQEK